jgi:lysophospholipid acyltransferase (LPLAT)-like uncharacterized protein
MSTKNSILAAIQGWLLAFYTWIVYRTCKVTIEGWEHLEIAQEAKRPIIFVTWHGQVHLFYASFRPHFDVSNLYMFMVGDERQSILGYFARYVGAFVLPVSMDDSSMAAARNLRAIIKKLVPGTFSYVNPDGPDGPARVAKPGVAFMARQAEAPLIPIGNASRYALHVPRWDNYWLPLPFDRIYTVVGPPIEAPRGTPREEVLAQLTDALNQADERAQSLASPNR